MAKSYKKNTNNRKRLERAVRAYVENQNKHVNRLYRKHIPAVNKLYNDKVKEITDDFEKTYGKNYPKDDAFKFGDNEFSYRTSEQLKVFQLQLTSLINLAIKEEWAASNTNADNLVKAAFPTISKDGIKQYYQHNEKALNAFLNRNLSSDKSRTISGRVWKISNQFKRDIEDTLAIGIQNGDSAAVLAKRLNTYLQKPSQKNIDIEQLTNKKVRSELEQRQNNKPEGQGVYNSSYKNARRLAANEANLAYRNAEAERIKQLDFVVGFEIKVSNSHQKWLETVWIPKHGDKPEICDVLAGKYPKEFIWNSWHVQCYDDRSEVYTSEGWKFFKDVKDTDQILTLNPDSYDLEYSEIIMRQERQAKEKMVHLYNKSLDMLVTKDHDVLIVNQSDKRSLDRIKADNIGTGRVIYRSSEWVGTKQDHIYIGKLTIPFELFCEFMGYYLSDGHLGRRWSICISQQDDNRSNIHDCITRMGLTAKYTKTRIEVCSEDLYLYLQQFGLALDKYIPSEIKNSTSDQIDIFLKAFVSCDGYIKKPHVFIGNRGTKCIPKEGTRIYYSSSKRMADDLGELILKIGKRPSFRVGTKKGTEHEFKNGIYRTNADSYVISECRSKTATQYNKEYVDYEGVVYDFTLAKNSTMYIRRNGKCFWGSNCKCFRTTILKTWEEIQEDNLRILRGEEVSKDSVNTVKSMPQNFNKWVLDNSDKVSKSLSKPYFWEDNTEIISAIIK